MLNEKSHAQKKNKLTISLCVKLAVTRGQEDAVAKETVKSQLRNERGKYYQPYMKTWKDMGPHSEGRSLEALWYSMEIAVDSCA